MDKITTRALARITDLYQLKIGLHYYPNCEGGDPTYTINGINTYLCYPSEYGLFREIYARYHHHDAANYQPVSWE